MDISVILFLKTKLCLYFKITWSRFKCQLFWFFLR